MITINLKTNAWYVAEDFRQIAVEVPKRVNSTARSEAYLLRGRIYVHASGRPGPEVVDDIYRNSFRVEKVGEILGESIWEVGTDAEQAYRLELGYHDIDAMGRRYNQPPFPHVGPAADETERALVARVIALVPG